MAIEVGSVFARVGAKVDETGFRRFDEELEKRRRQRTVEARLGARLDPAGFDAANRKINEFHRLANRRNELKVAFPEASARQVSAAARAYERELGGVQSASRRASAESHGLGSSWVSAREKLGPLHAGVRGLTGALIGGVGAFGLIEAVKLSADRFKQSEETAKQLENALKQTGGSAHVSMKQLDELASSIQRKTGIDGEQVKRSESLILTFRNVRNEAGKGNDIFTKSITVSADLAARLGKDLPDAAKLVGRALNDPIAGLGRLARVGVSFTKDQKEQIKTLVEHGHTLEAQRLILAQLEKQYKGSADAAGHTFQGSLNRLKFTLLDTGASIVKNVTPALTRFADKLAKFVTQMQSGTGAGGHFKRTVEDIWHAIEPVGAAFVHAGVAVAGFLSHHPDLVKTAAVVGGLSFAIGKIADSKTASGLKAAIGAITGIGRGGTLGNLLGGKEGSPGVRGPVGGGSLANPLAVAVVEGGGGGPGGVLPGGGGVGGGGRLGRIASGAREIAGLASRAVPIVGAALIGRDLVNAAIPATTVTKDPSGGHVLPSGGQQIQQNALTSVIHGIGSGIGSIFGGGGSRDNALDPLTKALVAITRDGKNALDPLKKVSDAVKGLSPAARVTGRDVQTWGTHIATTASRLRGLNKDVGDSRRVTGQSSTATRDMGRQVQTSGRTITDVANRVRGFTKDIGDNRRGTDQNRQSHRDFGREAQQEGRTLTDTANRLAGLTKNVGDNRRGTDNANRSTRIFGSSVSDTGKRVSDEAGRVQDLNKKLGDNKRGSDTASGGMGNLAHSFDSASNAAASAISNIGDKLNKALSALGVKTVDFGVAAGKAAGQASTKNVSHHATGGVVPGGEFGRQDVMTLVDPFGRPRAKMAGDEGILTRHQMPLVDIALRKAGMFRDGLKGLWRQVTRRHGYEQGGQLPGFASGGYSGYSLPLPKNEMMPGSWSIDQGVDIPAPAGTPEFAIGPGTIITEGISGFGPNAPVLRIEQGPWTGRNVYYGHAGPDLVKVGAHVKAGQQISSVGAGIVGISTGPHIEIGFGPPFGRGDEMAAQLRALMSGAGVTGVGGPGASVPTLDAPSITGPDGAIKSVLTGTSKKVTDAANQYLQAHAPSFQNVGSGTPVHASGNVAQWINAAMQAAGVSGGAWFNMLARQIQRESGGDPNSTNTTDINAQMGDPSRGLMQTIGSVFQQYHVAGTSGNIFDPVANIAAAIRYIIGKYGHGNPSVGLQFMINNGGGPYESGGQLQLATGGFLGDSLPAFASGGPVAVKPDVATGSSTTSGIDIAPEQALDQALAKAAHQLDRLGKQYDVANRRAGLIDVSKVIIPGDVAANRPPTVDQHIWDQHENDLKTMVRFKRQIDQLTHREVDYTNHEIRLLTGSEQRVRRSMRVANRNLRRLGRGKRADKSRTDLQKRIKGYQSTLKQIAGKITGLRDQAFNFGIDAENADIDLQETQNELTAWNPTALLAADLQAFQQDKASQAAGTDPASIAAAAVADYRQFQTDQAGMLQQFGANFAPVGASPFAGAGQDAGGRYYGGEAGNVPNVAAGVYIGGDVVNHFPDTPGDPHSWLATQRFVLSGLGG